MEAKFENRGILIKLLRVEKKSKTGCRVECRVLACEAERHSAILAGKDVKVHFCPGLATQCPKEDVTKNGRLG